VAQMLTISRTLLFICGKGLLNNARHKTSFF
jgi:hypothetical protein